MPKPTYATNLVVRGMLTGRFYCVPRAKVLGEGHFLATGRKHDITDALQPYLAKKFQVKAPAKKAARKGRKGAR